MDCCTFNCNQGRDCPLSFDNFWDKYPRKVAKMVAQKSWARLKKEEKIAAIKNLDAHLAYWKAKETEKEFIPHPATWLNQGRWEDEIEIVDSKPKRPPIPWYATDELTLEKGQELGLNPLPGESFAAYRQRITARIQRASVSVSG